jgi:hypothetical protein
MQAFTWNGTNAENQVSTVVKTGVLVWDYRGNPACAQLKMA